MIPALALLLVGQMSPAQTAELRKYRYGKTAAQIEAMGEEAYDRLFESRTPDPDAGVYRGVAQGVYVDAYRENTARRYRAPLPSAARARLLELDKQMRFIGVLFARNDWRLVGGNAFDPESDTLDFAQAERRLYTVRAGAPDPTRMRRRLATYRTEIQEKAKEGVVGDPAQGRSDIRENLAKIDRAVAKAITLCRTSGERAVLVDFVAEEAKSRL